ncbi:MAG: hypothetical protein D4R65_08335 [Verrucomicrobiaceae bacterium]|nr:MAG: hypothetical protein D4R65_08335 [Verrucomicrobiaceae bacterium]
MSDPSRRHFAALLAALGFLLPSAVPADSTVELIGDTKFELGFSVREDNKPGSPPVRWKEVGNPVWTLTHHHSKSSFDNREHFQFRQNGLTFNDGFTLLDVHPVSGDADVVLGLNADKEYGGIYRQKGDPWPHVYLTQRISDASGHLGADAPTLADMKAIDFSMSVKLLYDRANPKEGRIRSVHAAQFILFFTIQNLNRQSEGHGDYYWFGIALYDDREPVTFLHAMQDKGSPKKKGTDKLIYNVGVKPFTSKVVADGRWVNIRGDILPHILDGLREAWKRGYLPASQNLSDYRIGSLVMGWEIPGLNDAAVAFKDLRATATISSPAP